MGSSNKVTRTRTKTEAAAHVEQVATAAAERLGLEIVEVELKGAGKSQLLRITIDKITGDKITGDKITGDKITGDKTTGVTHEDCANLSREVSAVLDADDPIDGTYELEVTSPGVERKLKKWQDWERFRGQKAKVWLKEPAGDLKHFEGVIETASDADRSISIDVGGKQVTFPFAQVDKAHLKFEW
jgi:ribosome maturation factor RimP